MSFRREAIHSDPVPVSSEAETSLHLIDGALSMLVEHWDDLSDTRRREIAAAAAKRARRLTGGADAPPETQEPG